MHLKMAMTWICVTAVLMSGCSATARSADSGTTKQEGAQSEKVHTIASRMRRLEGLSPAPAFGFDDFSVPPGWGLEDYTESAALCERPSGVAYPINDYMLLDFATGRTVPLSIPIVNAERHFACVTVRLGDGWIAWEEISPNEGNDLDNAEWRLFAAPLDRDKGEIGKPIEVDGGNTSYWIRPHFVLRGDEVVWSRSRVTLSLQEAAEFYGRVMARSLPQGENRVLSELPDPITAFRLAGDRMVATTASEKDVPERLVVIDSTGSVVDSCTLDPLMTTSHFADYAKGYLTWSWFPNEAAPWPSLALRDGSGTFWRIDGGAGDGTLVNGYLLYERTHDTREGAKVVTTREIRCVDLASMGRSVLCGSDEGYWESCVAANPGDTYVVALTTRDDSGHPDATIVRRYRISSEGL